MDVFPIKITGRGTERDDSRLRRVVSRGKGDDLVEVFRFDLAVAGEAALYVSDCVVVSEDQLGFETSIAVSPKGFRSLGDRIAVPVLGRNSFRMLFTAHRRVGALSLEQEADGSDCDDRRKGGVGITAKGGAGTVSLFHWLA